MKVWRMWEGSPPPRTWRIVIAEMPDGITGHEPVPLGTPFLAGDMPPWANVANLMWRPAKPLDAAQRLVP